MKLNLDGFTMNKKISEPALPACAGVETAGPGVVVVEFLIWRIAVPLTADGMD